MSTDTGHLDAETKKEEKELETVQILNSIGPEDDKENMRGGKDACQESIKCRVLRFSLGFSFLIISWDYFSFFLIYILLDNIAVIASIKTVTNQTFTEELPILTTYVTE
jgi:hypothetical protein